MSAPGFSFLRHAPAEGNRYIFRHQFSDEVDCESCDKCGDTVDDILERGIDKILCNVPTRVNANANEMNVDSSVKNAKKHAHTFKKGVCERCNLATTEIISLPIDQVMCSIAPTANASENKYPVSMQRKMAMRNVMRAHLSENSISKKMKAVSI